MNAASIISILAPVITETVALLRDIAARGADPQLTVARLRALLPVVLEAAEGGATPETEQEWRERLAKRFGPPPPRGSVSP